MENKKTAFAVFLFFGNKKNKVEKEKEKKQRKKKSAFCAFLLALLRPSAVGRVPRASEAVRSIFGLLFVTRVVGRQQLFELPEATL